MKTIKINVHTGEYDYSGNPIHYQKEVDVRSLSESDLIRFLDKSMDEVCKVGEMFDLYVNLRKRLMNLEDSELSFLYSTTGAVVAARPTVGFETLFREMARRFYNRNPPV